MTAVVGVDGGTKALGLALTDGTLLTLRPKAGATDPVRRLAQLEAALAAALLSLERLPELVVVEGYALGSPGRLSLVRLAEVGGIIRTTAYALGADVLEVPPATLKRFATGHGNATKDDMVAAAVAAGATLSRPGAHDEADAYLLRCYGITHPPNGGPP